MKAPHCFADTGVPSYAVKQAKGLCMMGVKQIASLKQVVASAAVIAALFFCPCVARAQETVSRDVWLGSQIFGVEDLEALDRTAKLTSEQREAAQELMRSALPQARALVVQWSRGYSELTMDPTYNDDWESIQPKYADLSKRTLEEAVKLETDVMTNLKSLLTEDQLEGWAGFERHRRRLVLRSEGGRADIDVFGMVRAIKLSEADMAAIAPMLDSYERSLDSMVQEFRPLLRLQGDTPSRWYGEQQVSTPEQQKQYVDLLQRISQLHVRYARQIADALPADKKLALQKQRLFAEEHNSDKYESFRGLPHIRSALAIRSLSAEQKSKIKQLTKDADERMLREMISEKNELDLKILAGGDPDEGSNDEERAKRMRKLKYEAYQSLMTDVVASLNADQKRAYETGIEEPADIERLFARRRYAADRWSLDRDLWDNDAERMPLATADDE